MQWINFDKLAYVITVGSYGKNCHGQLYKPIFQLLYSLFAHAILHLHLQLLK